MKDPSGRELPKTYEYSMAARCYEMADTLQRADRLLAKAVLNQHNTTKQEMIQMISEASEMINNVINSIVGGKG